MVHNYIEGAGRGYKSGTLADWSYMSLDGSLSIWRFSQNEYKHTEYQTHLVSAEHQGKTSQVFMFRSAQLLCPFFVLSYLLCSLSNKNIFTFNDA